MQRQTGENKESDLLAPPKPDRIKPSGPSLFQTPVNPGFCIWASTPEFVCQNLPQASPACTARADLVTEAPGDLFAIPQSCSGCGNADVPSQHRAPLVIFGLLSTAGGMAGIKSSSARL